MEINIYLLRLNRNQTESPKHCGSVSVRVITRNGRIIAALRYFTSSPFRAGFLSPRLFPVSASPAPGTPPPPPLDPSCCCRDFYTVCFLNQVQISPSSPIKSSNPPRLQSPRHGVLSERRWKTLPHHHHHHHLFSLRERKICSVCVCGCVKGPATFG